jgi:hypothetical protein
MSGLPWFSLDVDMPDDPKCAALGAKLRNPVAFGYVVRLYAYCYRHATDSFPADTARPVLEAAAGWTGKAGVLFDALAACGFLDQAEGLVTVHGVASRLGPHLAKLQKDRDRKAEAAKRSRRVPTEFQRKPHGNAADSTGETETERERETLAGQARAGLEPLRKAISERLGRDLKGAGPERRPHVLAALGVLGHEGMVQAAVEVDSILRQRGHGPLASLGALPGFLEDTVRDREPNA